MPKTPTGAKRPADVIGNAVHVMKVLTGQTDEKPAKESSRKGGLKGGNSRAKALSAAERTAIAKKGASARWKKKRVPAD